MEFEEGEGEGEKEGLSACVGGKDGMCGSGRNELKGWLRDVVVLPWRVVCPYRWLGFGYC